MPDITVSNSIDTFMQSADQAEMRTRLALGDAATKNTGTTAGTVAAGDDSRLSNARTPTAHAASHAAAGSDPITITASQISGSLTQSTTGTAANVTGTVAISNGGTGQTTQQAAANALLPSQSSNNGKFLTTDGTNTSWAKTLAFAQTKTVGVDATTIQGCIDLVSGATASNQTQILIPPGAYTENLTLKPCVSLASTGGNNGQGSVVRVNGVHTATGAATAGDSILEINGIRFENTTTSPTITFNANGTTQFLVILEDCMVGNSNASTAVSGVVINANVVVRAVNVRSLANSSAGQGGTHWDLNGGSLYANGCSTEYGTCALLMRGTNGANYPYAELKGSYLKANGANTVSITSTTALLTAGWCSFENQAATANGINIAAGSVVGVYNSAFVITAGASNYVVNGAAGSLYFSTGNSYSNSSLIAYETKIGASVAQYAYTSTNVSKSGDTMTGKLITPASTTSAAGLNIGSGTAPTSPSSGDIYIAGDALSYRGSTATRAVASVNANNSFSAAQSVSVSSSSAALGVTQTTGSGAAIAATQNSTATGSGLTVDINNTSSTAPAVRITNQGTGNCLTVEDSATPDATPFAISASGRVGVGVTPDATAAVSVDAGGIKFGDGTIQTTASSGGVAGVSSFSAGTTGLTPATGTTGAVTLAGTLAIANGGTGATTQQAALNAVAGATTSGQFLRGNGTNVAMSAIQASDVPTLNQNTTGTSANVTGTVAIANGGTGQTTRQAAMDALAGATTSGQYLRGNGTDVVMSAIQAADVPTLNQNTTGTAANVTGTVAIANGGTGSTTATNAINALLPSQTGNSGKVLTTNGSVASWGTAGGSGITALTGDVTASGSGSVAASVVRMQGRNVSNAAPTDGQVLGWNAANSRWEPVNAGGGASYPMLRVMFTVPGSGSYIVPAGYKYADIFACSGGGGGGGGAYSRPALATPGGGAGGAHGMFGKRQRIYVENDSITFTIGAGGVGGYAQMDGPGTNGSQGQATLVGLSTNTVFQNLLDLGYYTNTSYIAYNWGQAGTQGSGNYAAYIDQSYYENKQPSGPGGYSTVGSTPGALIQVSSTTYVSSGGGGGGADALSAYDGGNIIDTNLLLFIAGIPIQYQGKVTSSLDASPSADASAGDIFFGGAGGAGGTDTVNIYNGTYYRAGNGANGQYGCGGGGGGAMYDSTSNPTDFRAGAGGNGGDGFVIIYVYR